MKKEKKASKARGKVKDINKEKTVKQAVTSIVPVWLYPNKGKFEIDSVNVNVNGKDTPLKALSSHKLDIDKLKIHKLIKSFYKAFAGMDTPNVRLAYKNTYGLTFGFSWLKDTSYKCIAAHHLANGLSAIVFNQNALFNLDTIDKVLDKQDLSYEKASTYRVLRLSDKNLVKAIKATTMLLNAKQG